MGGEGHINSLFPHTAATAETERLVVGVEDSQAAPRRITLTPAAVRRSREVWLVVSGEAKAEAVAAAIGGAKPADVPPPVRSAGTPRCGCSTPPRPAS